MIIDILISIIIFSLILPTAALSLYQYQDIAAQAAWRESALADLRTDLMNAVRIFAHDSSAAIPHADLSYDMPCSANLATSTSSAFHGHISSLSLATKIADAAYARAISADCGGQPPISPPASTPTSAGILSQTSIDAINSYIYVSAQQGALSAPDLFIYKLHTDKTLELMSSLDIGDGIAAIDAIKNYVFAAVASSSGQFAVIDMHDKSHPFLVSQQSLPGVAGSYPFGRSIAYYAPYVFVGTHRTAGKELHAFDARDPAHPIWLGAIELNHNINKIAVHMPYAYLASSGNTADIIILNVSNPSAMASTSSLSLPGNEDTLTVFLSGRRLYAGRAKSASQQEIAAIDISSSTHVKITAGYALHADVSSLYAAGSFIFAGSNQGLFAIDMATAAAPVTLASSTITSLDYENSLFYGDAAGLHAY